MRSNGHAFNLWIKDKAPGGFLLPALVSVGALFLLDYFVLK